MNRDLFDPADRDRPKRRAVVRGASGWKVQSAGPESYSVSQVNALAREMLEASLPPLWVSGEVTGWKRHTSGHCYFALRDVRSQLRAVMFRMDAQRLPIDPEDGREVRALGTLTLYERRGEYQFVVRELEGVGADGLWRVAFEKTRAKLESEGLLAAERKRPLPRHPTTVGVVTSPVGAALHDILEVIRQRAPWTHVLFAPAKVQGTGAARELIRAISLFSGPASADVVIIGRGGGAMEDLWAFNDEGLARAIAASRVPVISAVGHEVDVTIADLIADWRAATPSAAAERAVPDGAAVRRELQSMQARLNRALSGRVAPHRRSVDQLETRLHAAARTRIERGRRRVGQLAEQIDALSPLSALRRGFAVPLGDDGRIVRSASALPPGTRFDLRMDDGAVRCEAVQPVKDV
jgi:exodeoxyribonuclease VII large subunit